MTALAWGRPNVVAEIGESRRQSGVCIVLRTSLTDANQCQLIPGGKYDADLPRWTAPLTWATCKALRGIFGDRLEIGEQLYAWADNEYRSRVYPALVARLQMSLAEDDVSPLSQTIRAWRNGVLDLYPYQETGVHFLTTARRALLTDEPGTGKTAQVIRTWLALTQLGENPFPALVICPNTLKRTWALEIEKWWPGLPTTIVEGSAVKKRQAIADAPYVCIINWESLRMFSRLAPYGSIRLKHCWICDPTLAEGDPTGKPSLCQRCQKELNVRPWTTVVADECHRAADPKAQQTRALWSIVTPHTRYRFGLTGTPIVNDPIDLWPALHMIDEKSFPSRSAYVDRYCLTVPDPWRPGVQVIGIRQEMKQEFFEIIDPQMRRMPKEAVLPFLPPKTYSVRYVDMHPKQAKAYDQMENTLVTQLDQGLLVAMNPLVQLTRLVQFASAYAEIGEDGKVKLDMPSCKVDALVEVMQDMNHDPVVVFAQSRQLIGLAGIKLESLNYQVGYITGNQSTLERQQAITNFQEGRLHAILCTVAAGGVGITLTRANTAVFLQRSWSHVENAQAEDRVHRIGAEGHDKINIIDIVAQGTVEERQRDVLVNKAEMLEEIVRDRQFLAWVLRNKKGVPS